MPQTSFASMPASAGGALPRLCVSALSGGGGKTLLSLGLVRAFAARGIVVKPFKKGPDYIDAAWLAMAAGRYATNLDPYMLAADRLQALFVHAVRKVQGAEPHPAEVLALLEGNRGLFDGMDVAGSCSTAELARILACPVILSVNCTKMTRTAAALVRGMVTFEPGLQFAGVVLNQVGSARHEAVVRKAIEEYTDLRVLGALPRLEENPLPERHMGIASCGDDLSPQARAVLDRLGAFVAAHVDMDAVLAAARAADGAEPLSTSVGPFWPSEAGAHEPCSLASAAPGPAAPHTPCAKNAATAPAPAREAFARPRIGYVRDCALWFYYEENLEALERAGAELVRLELVGPRAALWPQMRGAAAGNAACGELDGLYLGGGFPEDCAADLSASPHLRTLAAWAAAGMPIYAECGGFMLLSQGIEREGALWPMSGIFPVVAQFCGKPQGLGYVRGSVMAKNPYFPQGMELMGHEFHYSRCRWEGAAPPHALRLRKGQGMGREACATPSETPAAALDGLTFRNVWASYTHIFAPATVCWAHNFTAAARRFAQEGAGMGDCHV